MVIGNPGIWAERFKSVDIRLLECIVTIWPNCISTLPPQPHEDLITTNLVAILSKNPDARRLFYWLEYQYEPFGYSPDGTAYSKGEIDLAVFLDQDRERYLAYECKRLNVLDRNGNRKSLATPYVKEGVLRFVTEKYAENLPMGCMLGYVIDGDVSFARSKVYKAISDNALIVKLLIGPSSNTPVANIIRFFTVHKRTTGMQDIEIHHALLPLAC